MSALSSSSTPSAPRTAQAGAANGHAYHYEESDDEDESHMRHPDQVTVYWPHDLSSLNADYALAGWTFAGGPGELVVVVAAALSSTQTREAANAGLLRVPDRKGKGREPPALPQEADDWRASLRVVGRVADADDVGNSQAWASDKGLDVCLTVAPTAPQRRGWTRRQRRGWRSKQASLPVMTGIYASPLHVLGSQPSQTSATTSISLVFFQATDDTMLRFLTLEPLDLRRRPKQGASEAHTRKPDRLEALLAGNPHRWFEITGGFSPGTGPGAGLTKAVECINKVRRARERLGLPNRPRSAGNEQTASRKVNLAAAFLVHVNRFAQAMLAHPLLPRHFLSHRRPPSLLSLSCSAKQLSLRLSQISSFPSLAAKLRRQRQLDALGAHDLSRSYVATWNALWLMSNDVLLGMASSAILWTCKDPLATWLSQQVIERRLVRDVVSACRWLDDWPGGLKLNTELSSFYLDMYVGLVSLSWQTLLRPCIVQPLPTLLGIIAAVGQYGGGLALQLCLLTDLARLATLHLRFLHALARNQYSAMLHLVVTLLDLFRGKKRTLLSPRAATRGWELVNAHYDLDQLLLGAIFFTLILFLAPTVAVYHWLFALLVAAVEVVLRFVLVQGLVEAINHLPLLSLVLRLKDPDRVPGGVAIVVEHEVSGPVEGLKYTARRLESHPLPWAEVLRQGFDGHFVGTVGALPRLAKAIFTGEDVSRSGASAGATS